MNIQKIKNKLTLWKDINNFYSFDELVYLSNQYYEGVRILFASSEYIFDFNFYATEVIHPCLNKDKIEIQMTYNQLLFNKKNINKPNDINHEYNPWFKLDSYILYKKDFKKQFKQYILNAVLTDCPIKKFCLLSELYQNILDGVNI